MKICFLENTSFEYSYKDKNEPLLRGAESIMLNLSNELKKLGLDVFVFNNCTEEVHKSNAHWYNINHLTQFDEIVFDFAIANGDASLLNKVKARKYMVYSHSIQSIEKFIRKKQLMPYLRYRPTYIIEGQYHRETRPKITSVFGLTTVQVCVDEVFLNTEIDEQHNTTIVEKNTAIFTSRRDRNLDLLIDIWQNHVIPKYDKGNLLVTPGDFTPSNNINFRKMAHRNDLIRDMLNSKMLLMPGHKAELFCLAAEEARELCIPTVTLGIGSLYERVEHGVTGFIAKNKEEFAKYAIDLFKDNSLWLELRNNLLNMRGRHTWEKSAKAFKDDLMTL
ncbi:MAG: glycosyltransferase [Pseudomonadota bacterium]|nr:glycosyltransferase [Pseudomonadota bacterium]